MGWDEVTAAILFCPSISWLIVLWSGLTDLEPIVVEDNRNA